MTMTMTMTIVFNYESMTTIDSPSEYQSVNMTESKTVIMTILTHKDITMIETHKRNDYIEVKFK